MMEEGDLELAEALASLANAETQLRSPPRGHQPANDGFGLELPGGGSAGPLDDAANDEPEDPEDPVVAARRRLELLEEYDRVLIRDMQAIDRAMAQNAGLQTQLHALLAGDLPEDLKLVTETALARSRTPYLVDPEGRSGLPAGPPGQNPRLRNASLLYSGSAAWSPFEIARLKMAVKTVLMEKAMEYFERVYLKNGSTRGAARAHAKLKVEDMSSASLLNMIGFVMDGEAWSRVAALVKTRTASECQARYNNVEAESVNREPWTEKQKDKLVELAKKADEIGWQEIARKIGHGRTTIDCFRTWKTVAKARGITVMETRRPKSGHGILWDNKSKSYTYAPGKKKNWKNPPKDPAKLPRPVEVKPLRRKGKFTPEEDANVIKGMAMYGTSWTLVQLMVPTRSDTQCRERYLNFLSQEAYNKEPFTLEEREKLGQLVAEHGRKWATIAMAFGGKFSDDRCRREWDFVLNQRPSKKRKKEAGEEGEGGELEGAEEATPRVKRKKNRKDVPRFQNWSLAELDKLREYHAKYGDDWKAISDAFGNPDRFTVARIRHKWTSLMKDEGKYVEPEQVTPSSGGADEEAGEETPTAQPKPTRRTRASEKPKKRGKKKARKQRPDWSDDDESEDEPQLVEDNDAGDVGDSGEGVEEVEEANEDLDLEVAAPPAMPAAPKQVFTAAMVPRKRRRLPLPIKLVLPRPRLVNLVLPRDAVLAEREPEAAT